MLGSQTRKSNNIFRRRDASCVLHRFHILNALAMFNRCVVGFARIPVTWGILANPITVTWGILANPITVTWGILANPITVTWGILANPITVTRGILANPITVTREFWRIPLRLGSRVDSRDLADQLAFVELGLNLVADLYLVVVLDHGGIVQSLSDAVASRQYGQRRKR